MRPIVSIPRLALPRLAIAGLALGTLVATSGCGWFSRSNELYAMAPEDRPLEVPPEMAAVEGLGEDGGVGTVTASGTVAAAQQSRQAVTGFTVEGERSEVFAAVDATLSAMEGVEITSRAELLGAFDLQYQGSNFLVRVTEAAEGVQVSAVDPRGAPATGPAVEALMTAVEAGVAGR